LKAVKIDPRFFESNIEVLSTVFNRFKKLFLAAKHMNPRAINQISRRSKVNHIPVYEGFNKRFLQLALKAFEANELVDFQKKAETRMSIRDLFKILNLIEYKA
ncbi:hypothetical protein, partial [Staphylococcus aureus]